MIVQLNVVSRRAEIALDTMASAFGAASEGVQWYAEGAISLGPYNSAEAAAKAAREYLDQASAVESG